MSLRDFQEAHGPAGLVYAMANSNKNRPFPDKVKGKDRRARLSSNRHTFFVLWCAHAYTHHSDKNTRGNSNNEFAQVCLVSAGVRGAVVPVRCSFCSCSLPCFPSPVPQTFLQPFWQEERSFKGRHSCPYL